MRLAVLAAVILVAAGLGSAYAAGAFGSDSQPRPTATGVAPPMPDTAELAAIRQLVLRAATNMGDSTPTDGVIVPTTRRLAELVDVATAEPDTPVYFVLVHGAFTDYAARIPKGATPPTGTLLTLTIDPATNEVLGAGLVGQMPDVNAIGAPEPLPLEAAAPSCDSGCTPANQPFLDAAADRARRIAGRAYYTGAIVHDAANTVTLYLAHAPRSVVNRLNAAHPGVYVIHDDAPRPRSAISRLQNSLDTAALAKKGIDVVMYGPTEDGYLRVGVTSNVADAQAKLEAMYGPNIIRVVHAEPAIAASLGSR
jgi:hypothetical protein